MRRLRLTEVSKSYGQKKALDCFSYTFETGVYGILGENGAGKSTLMGLITDTLKRDGGTIQFNGREILSLKDRYRARVGYMPQEAGYYEEMSVINFLRYMADLKGIPAKKAKGQIDSLLAVVSLTQSAHQKMSALSGGMRQRALMVQALLGRPDIIILDEPTAGLDPEQRRQLCRYIAELGEEAIVLLTSHIVSDIEDTADVVLVMKKGRLVKELDGDEITRVMERESLEDYYLRLILREE